MIDISNLKEMIRILEGTVDELEMYEDCDINDKLISLEQIERNLIVVENKFAKSRKDIEHFKYTERLKCK